MANEPKITVHGEELVPSTDPAKPSQQEPYPTGNPPGQTAAPSPEIPIPPEELCPPGQAGGEPVTAAAKAPSPPPSRYAREPEPDKKGK